jgi:hypothetical protein
MTRRKTKTPNRQPPLAASQDATLKAVAANPPGDRLRCWLLGGMTALLIVRPLFPSERAMEGDGLPVVMLWIALGVFWLLGAIGRQKFSFRFGWTDTAVLLLVVWTTVAAVWVVKRGSPRPAINMLWEWIGMALCFFLARQFIVTPRERRAVAAVMVSLAVAVSGYGFYQIAFEMSETRAKYEANPDRELRRAGNWYPAGSPDRKAFEDRLANTEPTATFALTNSLAAFVAPWAVMLVGMIVAGDSRRRTSCGETSPGDNRRFLQCKRLAAMLLCVIPIVVCLLLTRSRSGYAGACVGILLVWLFGRERRIRLGWKLPAALAGVAVLLLAVAVAVEGWAVIGRGTKSFGYRLQYWQSSLALIADHPWLGCGPGNFQDTYPQYKLPEASEEIADPHNFLLEIGATAGIPAALAFLAVLGCFAFESRAQGTERGMGTSVPIGRESRIPTASSDAWLYVLGGGAAGFLLSAPLGLFSIAPPGNAALLCGLPLAAVAIFLMFDWIRAGRLPGWLPALCVVALLIALLASGGIAMPGVAGTFWLLLALGLDGRSPRALRSPAAWGALAALLLAAVACYWTAYEPVLNCQAEMRLAERKSVQAAEHLETAASADPLSADSMRRLARSELAQAREHLIAATVADPLDAGPWRELAGVELNAWLRKPDEAAFARFTQAKDKMLELAPNSAPYWLTAGDWEFQAFSKKDERDRSAAADALPSAIRSYERAATLYPNSALCYAKLALAHFAAGDRAAFCREAETALRLDRITPHEDKKLPVPLRDLLLRKLK